jgi:hypothetical protein
MLGVFALITNSVAQTLVDGEYTFTVAFAEWGGKTLGATCKVIIKGNSVVILHDGNSQISGQAGNVLDKGFLMKHKETGSWIIGASSNDKFAPEVGGCTGGPNVIDLEKRIFWTC